VSQHPAPALLRYSLAAGLVLAVLTSVVRAAPWEAGPARGPSPLPSAASPGVSAVLGAPDLAAEPVPGPISTAHLAIPGIAQQGP
jgi:hypothetical protein